MTKEIRILNLRSRINLIENRGTFVKSPGVLNKLRRQLKRLTVS